MSACSTVARRMATVFQIYANFQNDVFGNRTIVRFPHFVVRLTEK
jgi:hypothetical protein